MSSLYTLLTLPSTMKRGPTVLHSLPRLLRGFINTKRDGIPPRPRAAGDGEHSAALKQNQIVEIWEVLPSQHLACMGPTPLCNSI